MLDIFEHGEDELKFWVSNGFLSTKCEYLALRISSFRYLSGKKWDIVEQTVKN